ncbi:hypothetical protein [Burkholderia ubonensis]|uniref:hypothetical protein n=1 Tax=Burkholderia ubonensis TaxID=101571 RepID=UPI000A65FFB4|nr:hypothetical protein [Burkholderia ubonensis]
MEPSWREFVKRHAPPAGLCTLIFRNKKMRIRQAQYHAVRFGRRALSASAPLPC